MSRNLESRIREYRSGRLNGYKQSAVGFIPEEWEASMLSHFIKTLESGSSLNCDSMPAGNGEIGILKTSSVSSNGFDPKKNKVVFYKDVHRVKVKVKKDHILIIRKNTPDLVGTVAYVDSENDNLYLPDLIWQTEFQKLNFDKKWLYYYLNTDYYRSIIKTLATGSSKSMPNITKTDYLKIDICIPSYQEQQKIAEILSAWVKAIELKEKLIEQKKEQKRGLMQKLLTGKLRLPGFESEWMEVALKDVLTVRKERSEVTDDLELFSLTIENGVTAKTDRYNREFLVKSDNKKYKITKYNDIVYNPANLRFGAIAINKNDQPVLLSPIYEVLFLKDEKKGNINFLSQLLTWERNIRYFETKAEGTLVERMAVKIDTFLNLSFYMPKETEEQKRIAELLMMIDREVKLQNDEQEALKLQKKGLMQLLLTGIIRV